MKRLALLPLLIAAAPVPVAPPKPALAPSEIVASAPKADWVAIAPADLIVMELAADARGKARRVVIQLMPAPFSQGWVSNIRKLVAARWYDGVSVNRVQDNYVVQWGDASEKKPLPEGLAVVPDSSYDLNREGGIGAGSYSDIGIAINTWIEIQKIFKSRSNIHSKVEGRVLKERRYLSGNLDQDGAHPLEQGSNEFDPYSTVSYGYKGWPLATDDYAHYWPIHCYGMVGVGRGLSPDTGTGAELYTVIGHAPRHLDRNIALVGRVIEGIEHLSSLPRGTGALGFYESAEERVPILSVRMGSEVKDLPAYQYLSTESASFAAYADARANRRDAFFIRPAGGADICNIPVPVRRVP